MSISSIGSYGVTQTISELLSAYEAETQSSVSSSSKITAKGYGSYGSSMVSGVGQAAVNRALDEITPNSSGKITFAMIKEHRATLEKELTEAIQAGLFLDGVKEDVEFTMIATTDGTIEIQCDDSAEKEKIEKFLKDNPKVGEQFLYVQALGNLERAQGSTVSTRNWTQMRDVKAELQAQSVAAFFAASEESGNGFASLMGDFGANFSSFSLGANYTV